MRAAMAMLGTAARCTRCRTSVSGRGRGSISTCNVRGGNVRDTDVRQTERHESHRIRTQRQPRGGERRRREAANIRTGGPSPPVGAIITRIRIVINWAILVGGRRGKAERLNVQVRRQRGRASHVRTVHGGRMQGNGGRGSDKPNALAGRDRRIHADGGDDADQSKGNHWQSHFAIFTRSIRMRTCICTRSGSDGRGSSRYGR